MGDNMNILHYSLGLPPYRTGGLTKYSFDLMKEQVRNGENVYLLFPGKISFIKNKTKIKYYKNEAGIITYEIVNPLPVPLLNGISEPERFMKTCDKELFKKFLLENSIQIVHIHTLMGLHKEFLESAKELNIKVVYTTHDYFGICTKVNFIDNEGNLCNERNLEKCLRCNKSGYRMKYIMMLQSPVYRFIKNKGIISKLKPLAKKLKISNTVDSNLSNTEIEISTKYRIFYNKLINYYSEMFNYIDSFLFNSTIAERVYNQYFNALGDVISITHGDIKDNRKVKQYNNDKLKLTYLGPNKKYKGFNLLMDAMKELNKEYKSNIELNLYGDIIDFKTDDNIKAHGRYSYDQLSEIFDNTDLLVVPSICNETFGFIVLEGLSYGVPVLVTDKVGSKDIINNCELKKGIIIESCSHTLEKTIIKIMNNKEILKRLNQNIINCNFEAEEYNHFMNIKKYYMNLM